MRKMGERGRKAQQERKPLADYELPDLKKPQDAARRLDLIAQAVGTGRLGHAEGRTMTAAVREWLKAFEAGSLTDEIREFMERVNETNGTDLSRVK